MVLKDCQSGRVLDPGDQVDHQVTQVTMVAAFATVVHTALSPQLTKPCPAYIAGKTSDFEPPAQCSYGRVSVWTNVTMVAAFAASVVTLFTNSQNPASISWTKPQLLGLSHSLPNIQIYQISEWGVTNLPCSMVNATFKTKFTRKSLVLH